MKNAILVVLITAAVALLSIIGLTGVVAVRRANAINDEIVRINSKFHDTERNLEGLRADLDATRVAVRDYMLDPLGESEEVVSSRFRNLKASMDGRLGNLSQLLGDEEESAIEKLQAGLNEYFDSFVPILEAGPLGFPGGTRGIRKEMTSRREVVVTLAQKVAEIDERRFARGNAEMEQARRSLSKDLWTMTAAGLLLGMLVAFVGGHRIMLLQDRARSHQQRLERTEGELRRLSTELVRAQEEERRAISRELHDQVGQTVTALGIEIGNIERLRDKSGTEFSEHVAEAKQLAQDTLRSVRDMAMGIRPSLLDDSGLAPALRWQARDFSKRVGVPVDFQIAGSLDGLPDNVSTCLYRIVQEALTNCARHAQAKTITIALQGKTDYISVEIRDDGVGFDPSSEPSGLGIIGIEERARELGGNLKIVSAANRGTLLLVEIPLKAV